ncbi:MAG: autotransporter domain-containing protein [Chlamydiae bacterium]|nr:autotransporter domain-containing protein [Chlamydiota bacterium]
MAILRIFICISIPFGSSLFAATWNLNANGNWNVNGNWTAPVIFPNAIDAQANMLNIITANRTVTLGQNITIGIHNFDDNNNYSIASGANTLFYDVSAGTASLSVTNVNGNGAHTISCGVALNDTLVMSHTTTANFTISGGISGAGGLTKIGAGAGALVLSSGANSYLGATLINAGNVNYQTNGAIPAVSAVTIGDGIAPAALLRINDSITAPNALGMAINSDGTLFQANNQNVRLTSVQGSGAVSMSVGAGAQNFIDVLGTLSTTFSGAISGGNASASFAPNAGNRFLKSGSSTLTMSGASTHVSRTFISGGMINVQNGSGLGVAGTNSGTFVLGGATLEVQNSINLIKTLRLNGAGVAGAGALHNVGGSNTLSGPIQIGWVGGAEVASDVTIQVNGATIVNSTNIISGANAITLIGGGTLEYSGALSNTYTGLTTLNGGTLNLNKSGGGTAVVGNVQISGGTLFWSQANQIANTATVTESSGAFTMNGNSETITSYTFNGGSCTLGGAVLTLTSAVTPLTMRNTTIPTPGTVMLTGGGTVVFDNANNGTATIDSNLNLGGLVTTFNIANGTASSDMLITGVTSNGGITKIGAGTLELTGTNTYAGGITITAGTLQGHSNSLVGNIVNNSNLVFDQNFTGTYAGMMSGTGTFVKQGSGSLSLTNTNSIGGVATVAAGSLLVNNSLGGAGALIVNAGATLGGMGPISKNITVNGILSPGNSIDTLVIIGDVIQATGSTLRIEISPTSNDLVDITGTYTINPGATFELIPISGNYLVPFFSYTIVTTTGGVTGTFSTVTNPLPLFLPNVVYTPTEVLLQLLILNFTDFFKDGNGGEVAFCLDFLDPTSDSDLGMVVGALRMLPNLKEVEEALLQLQPSAFTSLAASQENDTLYVRNAIFQKLDKILYTCLSKCPSQTSLWITPFGGFSKQKSLKQEPGFHSNSPGALFGVDHSFTSNFSLGAGAGYTYSHLRWKRSRGVANIHSAYGALYSQLRNRRLYLQSIFLGAYNWYEVDRKIHFGTPTQPIHRTAHSHHSGAEASAHLKAGLMGRIRSFTFSPFASLDFLYLYENSFKEKGAKSLNLRIKKKDSILLIGEGGVDLSYCISGPKGEFTPFMGASYIWEDRLAGKKEKATFQGCPLDVKGLYPSRSLLGANGGFHAIMNDSCSKLSLLYQGKFQKHFQDHSLYLQFAYEF